MRMVIVLCLVKLMYVLDARLCLELIGMEYSLLISTSSATNCPVLVTIYIYIYVSI